MEIYAETIFRTADNQAAIVPAVRREKARRALWLECERRPLAIDADLRGRGRGQ